MQGVRNDQITFTRFIAALAIVVYHYGSNAFPFNTQALSFIFKSANVGVSYFFTLSGFIMVLAYSSSHRIAPLQYYKSRFARIGPAYYLSLALCGAMPLFIAREKFDLAGFLLNATMLQAWVPSEALSINPPGWSLSTEVFFYAIFPFLFNFMYKKWNLWAISTGVVTFFLASQLIHNLLLNSNVYQGPHSSSHALIYYFPPMHLNEFLIGNISGLFYVKYFAGKNRANGLPIIILMALTAAIMRFPPGLSLHNGALAVIFVPLIILIITDKGLFSRVFSAKPLVFLGEISYGIYILQYPVYVMTFVVLKKMGISEANEIFFIYLTTLIIVSALSFNLIETPLRKRINALWMTPGSRAALPAGH
jgi:peptidoglycan/LPS O-acetylase OafA/YrhL